MVYERIFAAYLILISKQLQIWKPFVASKAAHRTCLSPLC